MQTDGIMASEPPWWHVSSESAAPWNIAAEGFKVAPSTAAPRSSKAPTSEASSDPASGSSSCEQTRRSSDGGVLRLSDVFGGCREPDSRTMRSCFSKGRSPRLCSSTNPAMLQSTSQQTKGFNRNYYVNTGTLKLANGHDISCTGHTCQYANLYLNILSKIKITLRSNKLKLS